MVMTLYLTYGHHRREIITVIISLRSLLTNAIQYVYFCVNISIIWLISKLSFDYKFPVALDRAFAVFVGILGI